MYFRLAILAIFCIVSAGTFSQSEIKGIVIDNTTQKEIEFANIALLKQDSTFIAGVLSDKQGVFSIDNIDKEQYILSITYVGYEKKYNPIQVTGENLNLGKIKLKTSDVALRDVTVTGNAIVQKADRKLIVPTESQIKASNSGVSLLRNLQLSRIIINPINNTITVPNGDAVQLRMNGREVSIEEIMALKPSEIIRIEYHDDPGMRYGNAPAVIDYITRRNESGGNVSANLANVPFYKMDFGENFASAKLNNKKSEFSVNGYWRRRGIEWNRENLETYNYPNKTLERTEEGQPTKYREYNLNLALNYNLTETDKYIFNAKLKNNNNDIPSQFSDRKSKMYSSENEDPIHISDHSTWRSNAPSLDLYYQHNLKNEQLLIFNIVGTYIDSKSERFYLEKRHDIPTTDITSIVNGDKYSLISEGIYEKGLKNGKISGGLKHTQSYTKNVYEGNVSSDVNLKFAETYGYVEYQLRKGKFNYTFGVGGTRTYNSQSGSSNEDYTFRPTLRVSYNINDNAYIRYNGFISSYSPSLSDLNNVVQDIDSLQIRRGNANLRTVKYFSNSINAGYSKGIIGLEFMMRYSYDHKPIMENISLENINGVDKFVRTNMNQKGFHRLYSQLNIKLKPLGDYISLSVAPSVNRFISYGNEYTHTFTNWRVYASLTANYKKWFLNVEGYGRWRSLWGETLMNGERFHTVMAGYNTDKWSLGVMAMNPFTKEYTQNTRNLSALTPNISKLHTDNLRQLFAINFSINLNFGRQYKAGNKRLDNDDSNAGIMSGTK